MGWCFNSSTFSGVKCIKVGVSLVALLTTPVKRNHMSQCNEFNHHGETVQHYHALTGAMHSSNEDTMAYAAYVLPLQSHGFAIPSIHKVVPLKSLSLVRILTTIWFMVDLSNQ